jgi:GGDEF domain-containing protein
VGRKATGPSGIAELPKRGEKDRTPLALSEGIRFLFFGRIEGDQFVVLLESDGDKRGSLIKRLYQNLKEHNGRKLRRYHLSASMGIAPSDSEHPASLTEFLITADTLMYEQKRRGHRHTRHLGGL